MTEYCAPQLPYSIPDDLTIPQFILELESDTNEARPLRPAHIPWLIEDVSGRGVCFKEVNIRCLFARIFFDTWILLSWPLEQVP